MHQQVAFADAVAEIHNFGGRAVEADALIAVLAEDQRLSVFQRDRAVRADVLVRELHEGAVVEDVTVLVDLDEGGAFVVSGAVESRKQVMNVNVK